MFSIRSISKVIAKPLLNHTTSVDTILFYYYVTMLSCDTNKPSEEKKSESSENDVVVNDIFTIFNPDEGGSFKF